MKLNVAVMFGGQSVEHEVSIISALQAIKALDKEKYNVIPLYISKQQKIYYGEQLSDIQSFKNIDHLVQNATQVTLVRLDQDVVIQVVQPKLFQKKTLDKIDLVIPVMHGTNGEDGTIQGFLEMLQVPYAGSDLFAAAVGQDKVLQKYILHDAGLPITNWFWVYASQIDTEPEEVLRKVRKLIYPVIIKPARTGSSIGIKVVTNDQEYLEQFALARQYDDKIITEKVVKPLREINCSVLGTPTDCKVSVLEEVTSGFLDFDKKYLSNQKKMGMASTKREIPADLPELITNQIQKYAKEVFRVLGNSGVCRIDFLMDAETKTIYVNEINTIPGSLSFYLWDKTDLDFKGLMDALVKQALDRERKRQKMTFSYDSNILSNFSGGSKGSKQ